MTSTSPRRIKVVHYVNTWLPQASAWLYNQVRFLPPSEVESYIVCNDTWNLDQYPVPNIRSLENAPSWHQYLQKAKRKLRLISPDAIHLPLLGRTLQAIRPEILHSHYGHLGSINAALAKRHDLRHVVSFYGADVHYIPNKDRRWFGEYQKMGKVADQILCEGPFMANSIAALGIPREKLRVQRLGVDLGSLRFEPRCYRKGETLRFLMVASYREKKGIPYALEALARFRKTNDQFEVTLIGDAHLAHEKIEKEKILRTINETGLGSKVRLMGFQPHKTIVREAYRHHVFLAPSLTARDGDCEGGAPVSVIEMAATGMPIVSTTHCDIPFVLSERNAPFLVRERDSEGLCEAMGRLVAMDWAELLQSNRSFIEGELDARSQGEKLFQIYRGLLQ